MLGFSDLDELLLSVRDKTSKSYINEAILSFRSGAYRAAIVSTWIAVTFDIISKIRELAEQGDKTAESDMKNLETYIQNAQISKLQEFENTLLKKAETEYKFITVEELKDFVRLKEDRNLCAHPAMSESGLLYQPTAELVKMHIVHAIIYLLHHQPVQGKAAIAKIFEDIKKASFPIDFENTKIWLDTKYLNRAKPVLFRNLIHALLKGILSGDISKEGKTLQVLNTLRVVASHNYQFFIQERSEVFKKLINNISDDKLWHLIEILTIDNSIWSSLSNDIQVRIKVFLQAESKNIKETLNKYTLILKLEMSELKEVMDTIKLNIAKYIDEKITIYGEVGSYAQAKEVGEGIILPLIPYFNENNTKKVIDAIVNNRYGQIIYASGSELIIDAIFDGTLNYFPETIENWKKLIEIITNENDYAKLKNKVKLAEFEIRKS